MIALDTNVLVYAHRQDSPFHAAASRALRQLTAGRARWAIPWPCIHEFIAVVTHPRIYREPSPLAVALDSVKSLVEWPGAIMLHEDEGYLQRLAELASAAQCRGGMIHDARIAALCLHHGVSQLWTADRDFSRYPQLKAVNPLIA